MSDLQGQTQLHRQRRQPVVLSVEEGGLRRSSAWLCHRCPALWAGSFTSARFIILFLVGCLLTGCGYRFRADGHPLGIEIQSLAIPMIQSTSSNLAFEADFTRLVREEFISHSRIPIVPEERAQAVLRGRIYEIRTEPLSYTVQKQTVQGVETTFSVTNSQRLRIKMEMKLTDMHTGKVIWHEKGMEDQDSFAVGVDPLQNRFNEREALQRIAQRLAERIFLQTAERF